MRVIVLSAAAAALSLLSGQALAQTAGPSAQALGLRLLTWPGKSPTRSQVRRPAERSQPEAEAPAPQPLAAQPRPAPAALPTSIYAPAPPPTPVPVRQVASAPTQPAAQTKAYPSDYTSPRFYSLHRAYGQAPDPIPLSPQFFATPTQDLANPPPPPPRTVVTANGQVVRTMNADPSVN